VFSESSAKVVKELRIESMAVVVCGDTSLQLPSPDFVSAANDVICLRNGAYVWLDCLNRDDDLLVDLSVGTIDMNRYVFEICTSIRCGEVRMSRWTDMHWNVFNGLAEEVHNLLVFDSLQAEVVDSEKNTRMYLVVTILIIYIITHICMDIL
jgi:hypothetical protein